MVEVWLARRGRGRRSAAVACGPCLVLSLLARSRPACAPQLKTAPYDPRFPTVNQARNCFTRYNEFHKCAKEKDAEDPVCKKFASSYRSVCPTDWVDKWNEARENGTWSGKY